MCGLSNPVISAYLQGLILTGARREELAGLRWADVDFKWGSFWVKDKVAEEGRKIPLTPYLAGLLASLPRRNEPKNRIWPRAKQPRIRQAVGLIGLMGDTRWVSRN